MRNALFFILSAIIAALIVFFGINPINITPKHAVSGHNRGDKTILVSRDFLNLEANKNFAITPFNQGAGSSIGVRIVSFSAQTKDENDGAHINFPAAFGEKSKGKKIRIATIAPPIPYKASESYAIGLSDGENIVWANAIPKPETEASIIEIDAPPNGIKSLIINPDIKGSGKGIDLISMAIKTF